MNKVLNIFLGLFLIVTSLACAQQNQSSSITMKEFKERLANDKNLVILDVRTPEELTGPLGKIDNVINIPIQNLEQRINELKSYKEKEIIVICRTQNRSAVAVNILQSNGYKAKNVLGGMMEFRK
ncbi:MAG: rhodanese-like domain-containing protein [Ignavibacteriaceae bacterium]